MATAREPGAEVPPGRPRDLGGGEGEVDDPETRSPAGTAALACSLRRYLAKCGRLSGTVFLGTLQCMPGAIDCP